MPSIISFDIDLGRIHAFSNIDGIVCYNAAEIPYEAINRHNIVLIEVASAILYGNIRGGEANNRVKWVAYNSAIAGRIFEYCQWKHDSAVVLVSPSSKWTLGHDESMRQALAGVSGDNHDIREARTMQFYYATNPGKWEPFNAYFSNLSTRKGSKANAGKTIVRKRAGKGGK